MKVLVTGASGLLGGLAADRCEAGGLTVTRSGRRAAGPGWVAWDMAGDEPPPVGEIDCLVHAAPLWVLPDHMDHFLERGVTRMICFSSTSILTKFDSPEPSERQLVALLEHAESSALGRASDNGIAVTIFRPTLIYGYGRDHNISTIARFVRRFGFFPIAGEAAGRRQPVHAGDLAAAVVSAMSNSRTFGRTYELPGPETLTYRAMVQRIFQALGRSERILRIAPGLYRSLLRLAGRLGYGMNAAMVDRMSVDMDFDSTRARQDFNYTAEPFLIHPGRDLPES